jgi:hypothetical protein
MKVRTESLHLVRSALTEYLKQPEYGEADFARQYQALPLYAGWTGTTYLTTAGDFWFRNCEYDPPRIENDLNDSSEIVALVVAAERHPQLANLLPSRPDGATNCDECDGKGRVTVGNVSGIICGRCSGLGWCASTAEHGNGSYPTFEQALAKFRSFASEHGLATELVFLAAENALVIGDQLYIDLEALRSPASAREAYEQAVGRRLGVAIGALGELPDRRLAVYVYSPSTENEAERLMYPDGLKMTKPERNIAIRLVSRTRMWLLQFRYGRRVAERTREYFR